MENPTLTIRIPGELKKALAKAAKADDRSVTSFVVKAIREAIWVTARHPLPRPGKTRNGVDIEKKRVPL